MLLISGIPQFNVKPKRGDSSAIDPNCPENMSKENLTLFESYELSGATLELW